MDMEKTLAIFFAFLFLSLSLACWIKIELDKKLCDEPAVARLIALLLFLPLWVLCVFSLSEEASKW